MIHTPSCRQSLGGRNAANRTPKGSPCGLVAVGAQADTLLRALGGIAQKFPEDASEPDARATGEPKTRDQNERPRQVLAGAIHPFNHRP